MCLSVSLSVKSHLTYEASVRPENATYSAGNEGKYLVGICLKRLRSRVMPRNMSEKANMPIFRLTDVSFLRLTHSEGPEGTQRLSTTFSLHSCQPSRNSLDCPANGQCVPLSRELGVLSRVFGFPRSPISAGLFLYLVAR